MRVNKHSPVGEKLKNKQSFSLQNPVGELGPQGPTGRGTRVCLQICLLPVACQPADGRECLVALSRCSVTVVK